MKFLALLALASVGALRAPLGATSRGAALRATVEKPVATTAADDVYVLETPTEVAKEYEGGPKPGLDENERFACDASVAAWAEFQRGGAAAPLDNLREAAALAARRAGSGPRAALYWAGHAARTGYFVANALAGTTSHNLNRRFSSATADSSSEAAGFGRGGSGFSLMGMDATVITRIVLEAVLTYDQDWAAVDAGLLNAPWDMSTPGHRQQRPDFFARQSLRFVREAVDTLGRRTANAGPRTDWGAEERDPLYPDYYLNDFHYQSDGWLSERSANVYETSTETLFVGRQDAMQRATLLPLAKRAAKPASILEVACGTGRVATFARDNFPDAAYTAVDLSEPYLAKARENDAYWRAMKAPRAAAASFVRANAEALPFDDASFDAVACVYLFHELPEAARANAAREMARVVKPGGAVVFTDSIQRGDRPALDANLDLFKNMNEPHYPSYVRADVGAYFEAAGLVAGEKYVASTSKTLSFTKPDAA